MSDYYTTEQAAALLEVTPYTLRQYAKTGLLTAVKIRARLSFWSQGPVNELVRAGLTGHALSLHVAGLRHAAKAFMAGTQEVQP